jgi:outer membrane autotransporter protein
MRLNLTLLAAGILLATGVSTAQAQIYKIVLSGANEIPAVTTPGSGTAVLALNSTTHQMRLRATFANLLGNTTASHIHCCVVQPANAGVATTTPSFVGFPIGVTSGSWDNTYDMSVAGTWNPAFVTANGGTPASAEAAFLAGVTAGNMSYLNIHSASFPGGEIRGTPVRFSFVPSATAQTNSAAVALDSLGAGTGALTDKLMTLAAATSAAQATALERLLPSASYASELVTFGSMTTTFDQFGARLQGLRRDTGSQAPITSGAAGSGGFWVKANSLNSDQDRKDGFAGFESEGWDIAAGIETQLANGLTAGAAFSHTDHSLDHNDQLLGNTSDITGNQVSVYGTQAMGNAYVEGVIAYAQHDYEDKRNAGIAGAALADYEGDTWGGRIGAGYSAEVSPTVSVTPQIRLDWASSDIDGYTETGDASLALRVGEQSYDHVRSSLGAQFDMATAMGNASARPFVRAFWNHDFKDDGEDVTAAFVGGGSSFITQGQDFDSDNFTLGLGVNFFGQGNFSAALAYDSTIGDDYKSHVIQAKAYWAF